MPFLGMPDGAWKWQENLDGISYAPAGFSTATTNFAKFGQLYLQNGFASRTEQVVPSSWIKKSTTNQVGVFDPGDPNYLLLKYIFYDSYLGDGSVGYGYRFWCFGEDLYCAAGSYGHYICVWSKLGRVLAVNV
jgi:CubicO group peptidase (beta-lactamase class C family)